MKQITILTALVLVASFATAQTEPPELTSPPPIPQERMVIPLREVVALHAKLTSTSDRRDRVAESLIPLRDRKGRIEAYIVHIKSDPDAFARFGFQNGDIVRKINNMPMTDAKRWNFIVDESVSGRIRVLVVEIERGGETRRIIHMFREPDEENSNKSVHASAHRASAMSTA